jgi:MYXO-CTERM domain-containing protein
LLNIYNGGEWAIVGGVLGGAITNTSFARLVPQDVPAPPTTWLFGLAMLGLAGLGWKRAEIRDDCQSNWGW